MDKMCAKCRQIKPPDGFYLFRSKNGYNSWCKSCSSAHRKVWSVGYRQRMKAKMIYRDIKRRCEDQRNKSYSRYGGRGIFIADEWKDFSAFESWFNAGFKSGLSVDRVDNDGPYAPWNCRFATRSEQQLNKRTTKRRPCGAEKPSGG